MKIAKLQRLRQLPYSKYGGWKLEQKEITKKDYKKFFEMMDELKSFQNLGKAKIEGLLDEKIEYEDVKGLLIDALDESDECIKSVKDVAEEEEENYKREIKKDGNDGK